MKNRIAFTRWQLLQDPQAPEAVRSEARPGRQVGAEEAQPALAEAWRAWEAAQSSEFLNWFLFMDRRSSAVAPSGFVEDWICFPDDSGILDARARGTLGRRIALLRANPGMQIVLGGVAGQPGALVSGLRLGLRRVRSIRAYLLAHGVQKERIRIALRGAGWLLAEHSAEPGDLTSERSECRFQVTDAHWILARN